MLYVYVVFSSVNSCTVYIEASDTNRAEHDSAIVYINDVHQSQHRIFTIIRNEVKVRSVYTTYTV
jgi:hypothetical protein